MTSGLGSFDFFLELLKSIRTDILQKFLLPGLGNLSYWAYLLGLLVVAIVVTVLVNVVRSGHVSHSPGRTSNQRRD